ncbi:Rz1-like lysis system protein LysC [Klebsiella pneumoniae]
MMIALIALCLLAQLSGCNNTRTVYVKVPVVPLPASLTADTPQPEIPDNLTWGQSLDLNVSLLSALGQCNRDKADIRQAEKNEPRNSGAFYCASHAHFEERLSVVSLRNAVKGGDLSRAAFLYDRLTSKRKTA